ncbi:MAG: hypothetical protein AB7S94_03975 [Simkaniaceae bacterium]
MGLFSSKGEARLDSESHALLSDPGYAKHIEVRCYLVNREQLVKLFSEKNVEIIQLTNDKLYSNDVYLLVRCKNKGKYRAFGTLQCFIPNRGDPIPVEIDFMGGHMTSFHDCVIYIISGTIDRDSDLPKIKYEWDCLYTM